MRCKSDEVREAVCLLGSANFLFFFSAGADFEGEVRNGLFCMQWRREP